MTNILQEMIKVQPMIGTFGESRVLGIVVYPTNGGPSVVNGDSLPY
jgi:hypothetical protein